MVALLRGEAMDTERATDSSIMTAFGVVIVGLNPGIEFVTLGVTIVLFVAELEVGGTSLNVTTPFSSTDL
jgi:hypothetical protein